MEVVLDVERGLGREGSREPCGDIVAKRVRGAGGQKHRRGVRQCPGLLSELDCARDEVLLLAAGPLRVHDDGVADRPMRRVRMHKRQIIPAGPPDLAALAPGPFKLLHSRRPSEQPGVLLERYLYSPGERSDVSLDWQLMVLLRSASNRGVRAEPRGGCVPFAYSRGAMNRRTSSHDARLRRNPPRLCDGCMIDIRRRVIRLR
jgi:hypothetical protein